MHPPIRFCFLSVFPCYHFSTHFSHEASVSLGSSSHPYILRFHIHRDLSLCASFLVRIAGGGAAPSPLHPPTRFYFRISSPCYHSRGKLFCFSTLYGHRGWMLQVQKRCKILISSPRLDACTSLIWSAMRGEALRPPPCTPPPAIVF